MKELTEDKTVVTLPIEWNGEKMGVVNILGYPAEIPEYAKLVRTTIDILLNYFNLNDQILFRNLEIENWIRELASTYDFCTQKLEEIARSLSLDVSIPRVAFMIKIQGEDILCEHPHCKSLARFNEIKSTLLAEAAAFPVSDLFISYTGESRLFLLSSVDQSRINERQLAESFMEILSRLGISALIGIGNVSDGIMGYRQSFNQAGQSLKLLEKFKIEKTVTHIDDWGIIDLLDHLPDSVRHEFITRYMPRFNDLSEEMAGTLKIFLESDMNIKETAEKLHIHRNTLFYRLDKVHEVLKLDPKSFKDAMIIKALDACSQLNA
ncbi:helix-turn-helix domain-containing protein [Paenibacillus filicis]|uniref:Helix-turn-helix domain-containing protein n=1 Tax=Paenibacillus gyeongsangnamensis TaxID=3388067 RepID=A0ABT4QJN0_9BACL|nr:helix-turn-helix domain-containing protein [Paenibacillus filicis]MCZ8517082.1 helix-turn-helix domain-containing protein [Paenibacillus filicis]